MARRKPPRSKSLSWSEGLDRVTITQETSEHYRPIRQLTAEAFAASDFGHNGEADLIDALRDQCDSIISLVAVEDNAVVGHVLFSPAEIRSASGTICGMGLAPMAVLPSHQRRGIGTMLVREGLRRIAETTAEFTIVAGHQDYYPRFGFRPASQLSVCHGFAGMPQDVLFLLADEASIADVNGGRAFYHPAFGPQHE